ncbi:hypothetical protein H0H87_000315 [Tephrocybe sp. NHM501043]|nr:hypothetical protein H0H87_000315 [Tephrocybe sp. NHM501043]
MREALPRKNRTTHRLLKELVKEARRPNMAVKHNVALNAALRPIMSEPSQRESVYGVREVKVKGGYAHVPQPMAPNIIPANIADDTLPM